MLAASSVVVASGDQVARDLDGEVILLHLGTGTYYGLSGTGTRIWELVQEPRTVAAIRDTLVAEYDVEPGRCEADLLAVLRDLSDRGLIDVKEAPG